MYKIILVEDEEFVRKAIRDIIDWNALGFEFIGEAGDGYQALELIEQNQPDVILTDICMPFMDGLELSKHVRECYPTVKIVIITGYDEFEYAQKAVNLNVSNYVLKPVTSKQLSEILKKIKNDLDQEFIEKKDIERLRKQFKESLEVLRERFFINLISEHIDAKEAIQNASKLDVDICAHSYIVGVLRIDDIKEAEKLFGTKNKQLISFAVMNISKEILDKHDSGVIFSDRYFQASLIFMNKDKHEKNFKNHTEAVAAEIIENIKKFLGLEVTIGLGDEYDDIKSISYSYNDALTALEYSVLLGGGKVILKSDVERKPSFVQQRTQELLDDMANKIKFGSIDNIMKSLDNLFDFLKQSQVSISFFRTVLIELGVTILKTFDDLNVQSENEFVLDFDIFKNILEFNKLEDIKEYFKQLCRRLSDNIIKVRQQDWMLQVKKACAFIEDNYSDKNLTVQVVCDYLYLSTSYFSKIFKDGTGYTFKEYLTKIRMQRAKELLKNTSLKIYQVADKVGYADACYFSHSFKQNVGVTPKEYRAKK